MQLNVVYRNWPQKRSFLTKNKRTKLAMLYSAISDFTRF